MSFRAMLARCIQAGGMRSRSLQLFLGADESLPFAEILDFGYPQNSETGALKPSSPSRGSKARYSYCPGYSQGGAQPPFTPAGPQAFSELTHEPIPDRKCWSEPSALTAGLFCSVWPSPTPGACQLSVSVTGNTVQAVSFCVVGSGVWAALEALMFLRRREPGPPSRIQAL